MKAKKSVVKRKAAKKIYKKAKRKSPTVRKKGGANRGIINTSGLPK